MSHSASSSSVAFNITIALQASPFLRLTSAIAGSTSSSAYSLSNSSTSLVYLSIPSMATNETISLQLGLTVASDVVAAAPLSYYMNVTYQSYPSTGTNDSVRIVQFLVHSSPFVAASPQVSSQLVNTTLRDTLSGNMTIGESGWFSTRVAIPRTLSRVALVVYPVGVVINIATFTATIGNLISCTQQAQGLSGSVVKLDMGMCRGLVPLTLSPAAGSLITVTFQASMADNGNNTDGVLGLMTSAVNVSAGVAGYTTITDNITLVVREPVLSPTALLSTAREVLQNENVLVALLLGLNSSFTPAFNFSVVMLISTLLTIQNTVVSQNYSLVDTPAAHSLSLQTPRLASTIAINLSTSVVPTAQMGDIISISFLCRYSSLPQIPGEAPGRVYVRNQSFPFLRVAFLRLVSSLVSTSLPETQGYNFVVGENFTMDFNVTLGGLHNLSLGLNIPFTELLDARVTNVGSNLASAAAWSFGRSVSNSTYVFDFGEVSTLQQLSATDAGNVISFRCVLRCLPSPLTHTNLSTFTLLSTATFGTLTVLESNVFNVSAPFLDLQLSQSVNASTLLQAGNIYQLNVTLAASSGPLYTSAYAVRIDVALLYLTVVNVSFSHPQLTFSNSTTLATFRLPNCSVGQSLTVQLWLSISGSVPAEQTISNTLAVSYASVPNNTDVRFSQARVPTTTNFSMQYIDLDVGPVGITAIQSPAAIGAVVLMAFVLRVPPCSFTGAQVAMTLDSGLIANLSAVSVSSGSVIATSLNATLNATYISITLSNATVAPPTALTLIVTMRVLVANATTLVSGVQQAISASLSLRGRPAIIARNKGHTLVLTEPQLNPTFSLVSNLTEGADIVSVNFTLSYTNASTSGAYDIVTKLQPAVGSSVLGLSYCVAPAVNSCVWIAAAAFPFSISQLAHNNSLYVAASLIVSTRVNMSTDMTPLYAVTYNSYPAALSSLTRSYAGQLAPGLFVKTATVALSLPSPATYPKQSPFDLTFGESGRLQLSIVLPYSFSAQILIALDSNTLRNGALAPIRSISLEAFGNLAVSNVSLTSRSASNTTSAVALGRLNTTGNLYGQLSTVPAMITANSHYSALQLTSVLSSPATPGNNTLIVTLYFDVPSNVSNNTAGELSLHVHPKRNSSCGVFFSMDRFLTCFFFSSYFVFLRQ